jgi:DNA-binding transcriptional MerR regulator
MAKSAKQNNAGASLPAGMTAPAGNLPAKRANERPGSSLRLFEPDPALVYSIDVVERLTQMPRRKILVYCKHHLVSPVTDSEFGGYCFNFDAIRALRWIGYLDGTQGVNLAGIKLILNLTEELQRLRAASAVLPLPTQSSKSNGKK